MNSDERHEVAKRLRENASKHGVTLDYLGSTQVASWWLLLHTIGCESNEQESAFRMLADLIDPTCEMVVKYGHACCGRCGHVLAGEGEVEEGYYEFRPFCPDCGARVVRDDD